MRTLVHLLHFKITNILICIHEYELTEVTHGKKYLGLNKEVQENQLHALHWCLPSLLVWHKWLDSCASVCERVW